MHVTLDGRPLPDAPHFAAALRLAADHATHAGRLVTEARLDGTPVDPALLETPPAEALGARLDVKSADVRALVRDALRDAAASLPRLDARQRDVGRKVQRGETEDLGPQLEPVIHGWIEVQTALGHAVNLSPTLNDAPTTAAIASLATHLGDVRTALSTQDWCALADALAYDLPDDASRWGQVLTAAAKTLAPRG